MAFDFLLLMLPETDEWAAVRPLLGFWTRAALDQNE